MTIKITILGSGGRTFQSPKECSVADLKSQNIQKNFNGRVQFETAKLNFIKKFDYIFQDQNRNQGFLLYPSEEGF